MKVLARYGRGVCPVCNRVGSLDENANLRRHWTSGRGSPVCSGTYKPAATRLSAPIPSDGPGVRLELNLRGGRVFRCDVPLGLSDEERSEIAVALETLHTSMQRAITKEPTR